MSVKFSNNAFGTLASSITTSSTTITLTTGQGALFPALAAGDYFYATLINSSNIIEIIKVTARATDVLTVTRAQESTTAYAYSAGDRIELRPTAAGLNGILTDAKAYSDASIAANNINTALTGVPTAPTAAPSTNTTQVATTAFVNAVTSTLGTIATQDASAVSLTGGSISGMTSISDTLGNVRAVPVENKSASYTLAATDSGQCVSITTGGVIVPSGVLSAGQIITIYNNSASSQTITQGTGATLTFAAVGSTGNRTLAAYGLCTVICIGTNAFVIAGSGVA